MDNAQALLLLALLADYGEQFVRPPVGKSLRVAELAGDLMSSLSSDDVPASVRTQLERAYGPEALS